MRKRSKLLLALAVVLVATGATGIGKVLATGSPTPTPLSSYGTVIVEAAYTATGTTDFVFVTIFSSQGPFYTEKVNVNGLYSATLPTITLYAIFYEISPPLEDYVAGCPTVISHNSLPAPVTAGFGDIMSVVPNQMIDQTGAHAVPAQNGLTFQLSDHPCLSGTYPSGLTMVFEATVLAPTSAAVCVATSETYPVPSCLPT